MYLILIEFYTVMLSYTIFNIKKNIWNTSVTIFPKLKLLICTNDFFREGLMDTFKIQMIHNTYYTSITYITIIL